MIIEGTVHKVGDDVDTDVIIPGRYLSLQDPDQIARHIFEGVDPGFAERVNPGDILVAGRNFGCGSSREHAPMGLRALDLGCVVAASFARIFYRNAINLGLPILTCPDAVAAAEEGARMRVDTSTGRIAITGRTFSAEPFPPFLEALIRAGGLVPWVQAQLTRRGV